MLRAISHEVDRLERANRIGDVEDALLGHPEEHFVAIDPPIIGPLHKRGVMGQLFGGHVKPIAHAWLCHAAPCLAERGLTAYYQPASAQSGKGACGKLSSVHDIPRQRILRLIAPRLVRFGFWCERQRQDRDAILDQGFGFLGCRLAVNRLFI